MSEQALATVAEPASLVRRTVSNIEAHHGLDCVLVVSEALRAADTLPRVATRRGTRVLIAPDLLVAHACLLNGLTRASPRRLALLLARMPLCGLFAERLHRLELQLPLF